VIASFLRRDPAEILFAKNLTRRSKNVKRNEADLERGRENVIPKEPLKNATPISEKRDAIRERSNSCLIRASLKRDRDNVVCSSLRTMRSQCFLSLTEATKAAVSCVRHVV